MVTLNYKRIILFALLGIITGLTGFLFIVLVNTVIDLLIKNSMPKENNFLLIFSLVIITFFITRRLLSQGIIELSQQIFWNMRREIIKEMITAPYTKVKELREEIYASLTTDVNNITNASIVIIPFVSSVILVIACFIYLGFLSIALVTMSCICIGIGIIVYLKSSKASNALFVQVRNLEEDFMKGFNSILDGNKEIKINAQKGYDLFHQRINPLINIGEKKNVDAYVGYLNSQLISQLLFYAIIVLILAWIGNYFEVELATTISFVFVLLYLLGPIVNIMLTIPALNNGFISYKKLGKIRSELVIQNKKDQAIKEQINLKSDFEKIEFQNYEYKYPNNTFSVGPINLTIYTNEIIFIYGGNGSGKTTFINTLLTLFTPNDGTLLINGERIDINQVEQTRSLFSPIFSDFYLFDDFYGIENVEEARVQRLLKLFEIDHKVSYTNQKLSTIDLSTGQRKRLALIAAILENRPILVLDEWAADQDPNFRKKFYTEIIHTIVKEENKTIIAITHDDAYYSESDRLFRMNYGKLESTEKQEFIH